MLDHELTIEASKFLPVNAGLIPTGELRAVKATPFDFSTPHRIGERIDANDEQIKFGGGYDLNWVLDNQGGLLARAATVYEPSTGRVMDVLTTEPGVQFYTANHLDGTLRGPSRPGLHNARQCLLPGDATLSRLAKPTVVSQRDPPARRDHAEHDRLSLFHQITSEPQHDDLPSHDPVNIWPKRIHPRARFIRNL